MFKFILAILFASLHITALGQSEVKLYAGYYDYPGLSFEHIFKNNVSVEMGSSFRTKLKNQLWQDGYVDERSSNLFINTLIKKYTTNDNRKFKFFYGGYLRFWQRHQAMKVIDNMTSLQQAAYDQGSVVIMNNTNKISFGGLMGFKWPIHDKFFIGLTLGLGFSPRKLYWDHYKFSGGTSRNEPYEFSEVFGPLFHLSGIGQISFCTVLNSKKSKK